MSHPRITRLAGLLLACALTLPALLGCSAPKPTVTPVPGFDMPTPAPTIAQAAPVPPTAAPPPTAYPWPTYPTSPAVIYPEPGQTVAPTKAQAEPTTVVEPTEAQAEPTAAPEPTEAQVEPTIAPEPTEQPASSSDETVLIVVDTAFSLQDLEALEQVTAETEDATYTGASLLAILDAAGVDADSISVVGRDGYSANVNVAEIPVNGVLAFEDDGTLHVVIPGVSKGSWVRDVVELGRGMPTEGDAVQPIETKAPIGGPVDLVDAAGREVHLDSLPQRIVVVGSGPHMTLHILYMFEEGRERVVGSESRSSTTPSEFLSMVFDDFADVSFLDANPNVEQIATLQPDLVIIKGQVATKTSGALAQVDIPCMFVGLETVEMFFQDLENIGQVLGNPERAAEIVAFYQERVDRLAEGTADLADEDKPSCLLLSYTDRGGEVAVKVPAKAWMQTVELETAGGRPVWLESAAPTDGWTVVNLEQIAA